MENWRVDNKCVSRSKINNCGNERNNYACLRNKSINCMSKWKRVGLAQVTLQLYLLMAGFGVLKVHKIESVSWKKKFKSKKDICNKLCSE